MLVFYPENPKWDQNTWFAPLSILHFGVLSPHHPGFSYSVSLLIEITKYVIHNGYYNKRSQAL